MTTPEASPSFEEWIATSPQIHTHSEDEGNHYSWRCEGSLRSQNPNNPIDQAESLPETLPEPEKPDLITKYIPGSVSSFAEPAERYQQNTSDSVWGSFRDNIRKIQANRETYDLPEPQKPITAKGVKMVMSELLNDLDNNA